MNLRLDHTGTHTCIREIICERKCKFENFWRRKEMTIYFLDLMSSYKNVLLCLKSKLLLFRLFRPIPNVHTTLCQYVHCRLHCNVYLSIYMDKYSCFIWILPSGLNALWRKIIIGMTCIHETLAWKVAL